ncbi:MAG: hypothetical protein ACO3ND_03220 [Opitutales bacterium]
MDTPAPVGRDAILDKLRQTQPWLRFMGILTMITAVLMLLAGGGVALVGALSAIGAVEAKAGLMLAAGLLYAVLSLVYLFPALHLLRSARAIRGLQTGSDDAAVAEALEGQRRFWKYIGVVAIVFIVLYVLAILLAVALPVLAALQKAAQPAG